jgi:hypothetical protein
MATYTTAIVTTEHFEVRVPYSPGYGASAGDVGRAFARMRQEATSRGIPTDTDDWCWIVPSDEHVVLRMDVTGKDDQ